MLIANGLLIASGLLIVVGCTLVGYGAVQEEARRGLIPLRPLPKSPTVKTLAFLLAGLALLLVAIVALFIGHEYLGFVALLVSYVGCNLLTYVWGELITHRAPRPRRADRPRPPDLQAPAPGSSDPPVN